MQPTTTIRPPRARVSARTVFTVAAVAVLFVAIVGLLAWGLRSPTYVGEITVTNDTAYELDVDVGDGGGSRVGLGTAPGDGRVDIRDVLDQGDTWVFVFSFAGTDVGELAVERSELEQSDWTVEVPAEVGAGLEREGYRPSTR